MLSQEKVNNLKSIFRKNFHCLFGKHHNPDGRAHFCSDCGELLNRSAYSQYEVYLTDGTKQQVKAFSEKHATEKVVYGGNNCCILTIENGQLQRLVKVHPSNILKVIKL